MTPTSYLELLTTFIKLLGEKRAEINETKRRLEVGLQKLLSTAQQVGCRLQRIIRPSGFLIALLSRASTCRSR